MNETNRKQEAFQELKKKTEAAFRGLGLGSDCRISLGIDDTYLNRKSRSGVEYGFLLKVRSFSEGLAFAEREILINDVLESGHHYLFWYLTCFTARDYRKACSSLAKKIEEAFSL